MWCRSCLRHPSPRLPLIRGCPTSRPVARDVPPSSEDSFPHLTPL
ncbi:hypothetical protein UO65_2803 [Actinokineospora spheciospongiae]|uniref:Uncharacterized protein n=1 Tax=Actinokineospora spheciospongiae TaxID=909613 RepID=W7ILT8_9PSEU|nr:hypothetical protein UO65_2803 [Actinokineospora spheciospongiae]